MEITAAMAVTISVPMMAWRPPPPSPTTLRRLEVKNSGSKRLEPLVTAVNTSEMSGMSASTNATVTRIVMTRSFAFRSPSTAREKQNSATPNRIVPNTAVPTMLKLSAAPESSSTRNTAAMTSQDTTKIAGAVNRCSLPAVRELGRVLATGRVREGAVVAISSLRRRPCGG